MNDIKVQITADTKEAIESLDALLQKLNSIKDKMTEIDNISKSFSERISNNMEKKDSAKMPKPRHEEPTTSIKTG
jgi:hypothetical protein